MFFVDNFYIFEYRVENAETQAKKALTTAIFLW